jgi:hypothetical protein
MSPPKATTNVDLGGDERGVNTTVGVGDGPEPDPAAWWFTRFHCRESTVLGETCALLDEPPSP